MRPIDADVLKPTLKAIIEAETQVYGRGSWGFATRCLSAVEDAPTVEPERKKGKWIPCSERCPVKEGRYLAATHPTYSHDIYIEIICWSGRWSRWVGYDEREILAWMPLPDPYQEEDENQ